MGRVKKKPRSKNRTKKQGATKTLTRQMRRRVLVVMVVLVILCSGGSDGPALSLQILQSEYLQRGAVTQQLSDITISPNRGQIFDANMSILAPDQGSLHGDYVPEKIFRTRKRGR